MIYGMPNTINMLTPAMRIIGFLRRLNGETVFQIISKHVLIPRCTDSGKLTARPLNKILLPALSLHFKRPHSDLPLDLLNMHNFSLIVPLVASKCPPNLDFRDSFTSWQRFDSLMNIDPQWRKGMCVTMNIEEVRSRADIAEIKGAVKT
jgi:hypothetical protein